MASEEQERLMNFILQSQAHGEVRLQRIEEAQEKSLQRVDRLERLAKLFVSAGRRERRERRAVDEKVGILISAHIEFESQVKEQISQLVAVQAHNEAFTQRNSESIAELRASIAEGNNKLRASITEVNAKLRDSIAEVNTNVGELANTVRHLALRNGNEN